MPNTYTLISSNILSSSAGTVTFSSIPATYTDLMLLASIRTSQAGVNNGTATLTFNGDTAANYGVTSINAYGSGGNTGNSTGLSGISLNSGALNSAGHLADTFTHHEMYIASYKESGYKTFMMQTAGEDNVTSVYMGIQAGLWSNSAALTSITYTCGGNFVSGSSFYLYGIKNS